MKQKIDFRKNYTSLFALVCMAMAVVFMSGCSKKDSTRAAIESELEKTSKDLPMEIMGKDFVLENMSLDGDYMSVVYSLSEERSKDYLTLSEDVITSDKNVARVLNNFEKKVLNSFLDAEIGLKLKYKIKETGKDAINVEVAPERLAAVVQKMRTGELKAYSTIEVFEEEIKGLDLPVRVDDVTMMKKVEIKDNNVHYVMEIEIDGVEFDEELIAGMKKDIIENLSKTPIAFQKSNMLREDIHIVYDYLDKKGKTLASIDISPIELKSPKGK